VRGGEEYKDRLLWFLFAGIRCIRGQKIFPLSAFKFPVFLPLRVPAPLREIPFLVPGPFFLFPTSKLQIDDSIVRL